MTTMEQELAIRSCDPEAIKRAYPDTRQPSYGDHAERLEIRLSPEQMQRWRVSSALAGYSTFSAWIRATCDDAAVTDEEMRMLRARVAELKAVKP